MRSFGFAATLLGLCALTHGNAASAVTISKAKEEMWTATIEDATHERMLTQKWQSNCSRGHKNFPVRQFFVNGNSTAKISASPSTKILDAFKEVKKPWSPFKALLEDNIDTFRKTDGRRDEQILAERRKLLDKAFKVRIGSL
eukprot:TRINITY_DN32419_c2_g1_i1.p1 TRINITY_DN32419_c2_g1~~TRINITY_DN32419_c2_g1_i1.p1  ORF type:complete len:142 (+),score=28.84 TRINITY_DN32419_c2_g1_i1:83-508(+)